MGKAKKTTKMQTRGGLKARKSPVKPRSKTMAKPKPQGQPRTKEARGTVSLKALAAEIERISSKLDSIEKDVQKLKGVAHPIG